MAREKAGEMATTRGIAKNARAKREREDRMESQEDGEEEKPIAIANLHRRGEPLRRSDPRFRCGCGRCSLHVEPLLTVYSGILVLAGLGALLPLTAGQLMVGLPLSVSVGWTVLLLLLTTVALFGLWLRRPGPFWLLLPAEAISLLAIVVAAVWLANASAAKNAATALRDLKMAEMDAGTASLRKAIVEPQRRPLERIPWDKWGEWMTKEMEKAQRWGQSMREFNAASAAVPANPVSVWNCALLLATAFPLVALHLVLSIRAYRFVQTVARFGEEGRHQGPGLPEQVVVYSAMNNTTNAAHQSLARPSCAVTELPGGAGICQCPPPYSSVIKEQQ